VCVVFLIYFLVWKKLNDTSCISSNGISHSVKLLNMTWMTGLIACRPNPSKRVLNLLYGEFIRFFSWGYSYCACMRLCVWGVGGKGTHVRVAYHSLSANAGQECMWFFTAVSFMIFYLWYLIADTPSHLPHLCFIYFVFLL
jgi:hypothetical protein